MKKLVLALMMTGSVFSFGALADEMTGYISDAHCGAAHSSPNAGNTACIKKCLGGGSDPVLVKDGKVIKIDPASKEKAAAHAGENVTINGSMDGDILKIDSIETAK